MKTQPTDDYQVRERMKASASRTLADPAMSPLERAAAVTAWAMAHHDRIRNPPPFADYFRHWLASMGESIPPDAVATLTRQGFRPEPHPLMPQGMTDYSRRSHPPKPTAWLDATDLELAPHRKDNVGRRAANGWLLNETDNLEADHG